MFSNVKRSDSRPDTTKVEGKANIIGYMQISEKGSVLFDNPQAQAPEKGSCIWGSVDTKVQQWLGLPEVEQAQCQFHGKLRGTLAEGVMSLYAANVGDDVDSEQVPIGRVALVSEAEGFRGQGSGPAKGKALELVPQEHQGDTWFAIRLITPNT
jgi:hypothetical protein